MCTINKIGPITEPLVHSATHSVTLDSLVQCKTCVYESFQIYVSLNIFVTAINHPVRPRVMLSLICYEPSYFEGMTALTVCI